MQQRSQTSADTVGESPRPIGRTITLIREHTRQESRIATSPFKGEGHSSPRKRQNMKPIKIVAFAPWVAVSLACGAAPDTTDDANEPVRIDGTIEDDGMFASDAHRDDYCAEHPDSRHCSELGTAEQPWVSGEYHGQQPTGGFYGCYSASGARGNCNFPNLKQMKIQFDTGACFNPPPAGDPVPPLLAYNKMIQEIKNGAMLWNGHGSGVTVQDGTCSHATCHVVTIKCTSGDYLGESNYTGSGTQRVADLPLGPHGLDQTKAVVFSTSEIRVNLNRLWKYMVSPTPGNCGIASPTNAQIAKFAQFLGAHEQGHVEGFGHFGSSSMIMYAYPAPACNPSINLTFEARDALGVYNSSSSGGPFVNDYNLETWSP
jgi:hypothetical protein